MRLLASASDRLSRPVALLLAVTATLLCRDMLLLLPALLTVTMLSWHIGTLRAFARFLVSVWLPLAVALLFVWAGLVAAPPGQPVGSDRLAGLEYALLVSTRLAVLAGLGQIVLLGFPPDQLAGALRFHGLPQSIVVVAVAARTLVAELTTRLDQVWTARLARGVVITPSIVQRARHFPYMLRPLLSWTLRSAIQRSEMWTERDLLSHVGTRPAEYSQSRLLSTCYLLTSIVWMIAVIVW